MFDEWVLAFKNIFLPIFCKQCGLRLLTEENGFFCPTCWELSPRVERPFCSMCGRPHPLRAGFNTVSNFPCAVCRERPDVPFRRIYGAAVYEGAVEQSIKLLKFNGKRRLSAPLSDMMAEFASRELECDAYDYLVPVPLHKVRERDRGFNQSRLLARGLLATFPNAELDESLRRIRPTHAQSRMTSAEERRANVIGAFAVFGDILTGKRILLVDDVVTTGGTIMECAAALQRAKVRTVDVFAAALTCSTPDAAI